VDDAPIDNFDPHGTQPDNPRRNGGLHPTQNCLRDALIDCRRKCSELGFTHYRLNPACKERLYAAFSDKWHKALDAYYNAKALAELDFETSAGGRSFAFNRRAAGDRMRAESDRVMDEARRDLATDLQELVTCVPWWDQIDLMMDTGEVGEAAGRFITEVENAREALALRLANPDLDKLRIKLRKFADDFNKAEAKAGGEFCAGISSWVPDKTWRLVNVGKVK
jgi:hypothetical protein